MTARQFLKANPEKYVLVTYEFGNPVFVAPQGLRGCNVSSEIEEAEIWSALDNNDNKLSYFKLLTGYKNLIFQEIK